MTAVLTRTDLDGIRAANDPEPLRARSIDARVYREPGYLQVEAVTVDGASDHTSRYPVMLL